VAHDERGPQLVRRPSPLTLGALNPDHDRAYTLVQLSRTRVEGLMSEVVPVMAVPMVIVVDARIIWRTERAPLRDPM
jgi:hypothetical protein